MRSILLASLTIFLSAAAYATIFPERSNTELIYLDDFETDFQVRLEIIRQAKISIDLISFSQSTDPVGKAFLDAIRQVQQSRCVKVRYLYDGVASWIDWDFLNRSGRSLVEGTRCPGEVITIGLFDKWMSGLEWDDFFHEKILIVDAGTPDEIVVFGGRGYTRFSTLISDSGYLVRPIDPNKPSLGTDLHVGFETLWNLARQISPSLTRRPSEPRAEDRTGVGTPRVQPALSASAHSILRYLTETPEARAKIKPTLSVFEPKSLRLASNDLFSRIVRGKKAGNPIDRSTLIGDAHSPMITDIDGFDGTISVTSYALGFTDEILSALGRFVKRGNRLIFFTNGKEANARFIPGGAPVYYTAAIAARLLTDTAGSRGKIEIYFLDPKVAALRNAPEFVHRKLAIFDGPGRKFIYTGSDNFTWSSAKKNDEWMIRIDDPKVTEFFLNLDARERPLYREIHEDEIHALANNPSWIYRLLGSFIRRNY